MNWDAIGALAELAGAGVVVITLAYLAVQLRQNAKLVTAAVTDSDRDAVNELARILGSSSEASRIYRIGMENRASLTPDQLVQFDSLCFMSFNSVHQRYRQGDSEFSYNLENSLSQPGFRQYWEVWSATFPEDFRREVARVLEQADEPAAQQGAATDSA